MGDKEKKTELSELGEFGLISHLTGDIKIKHKETMKGVGDDAAILDYRNKLVVATSDILMEGIHFNLVYSPLKHLGYKAVTVNLSDIFAMNGYPMQVIISIAISSKFSLEQIDELYDGIKLACEKYGVDIAGGDTTTSLTGMAISITALGEISKEEIVYRNGARENDIICVSGDLGASYLGLQILEREKKLFLDDPGIRPGLEGYEYVLERQLKPEARKEVIDVLREKKVLPTAMIDISDGLSSEINHICSQSEKGCKLFAGHIPFHKETEEVGEELKIEPLTAALDGGEDYELLFTVSQEDFEKLQDVPFIKPIGHITAKGSGLNLVTPDGSIIQLSSKGWNPLGKNPG